MTDKEAVLRWLRVHGSIEPLTALREIGTFRLGARIWDLRHDGHDIETTIFETPSGSHVARYVLHDRAQTDLGL